MDPDDLLKIIIGLVAVIVGWLLSQATITVRGWFQRRKIARLLLEELRDIDRETVRLLYLHARNLQLHGAQGVGDHAAVGISNPIFSNYYKDVLLHLNQNQRISYQLVHKLVDAQNEILSDLQTVSVETHKEHRANGMSKEFLRGAERLGELSKHGYSNCAIIKWHIDFHLKNKANPDLSPETKDHEAYLIYLESVVQEMNRTIETGRTVSREDFEKIYNPQHFGART